MRPAVYLHALLIGTAVDSGGWIGRGKGILYHLLWFTERPTTIGSFVPSKLIFLKRKLPDGEAWAAARKFS